MENTEINGETTVLEENVETPVIDSDISDIAVGEESGTSGNDTASDAQPVESEGEASEALEEEGPGPDEADAQDEEPETVTQIVEVQEEQIYTSENPMPVTIVEPVAEEEELEVFALSGSYPGTISDTYLNYFRGIVQKLNFNEHYVVYRSGLYSYTMVYGEGVEYGESGFTGTGNVVTIYRDSSSYSSDWYVDYGEDSLSLDAGSLFVYSDLGSFPTLKEGGSALEFTTVLFAIGFAVVYSVCHDIFDYIMEHVYRK